MDKPTNEEVETAVGWGLVAIKRPWIPDWFYSVFIWTFGNQLGTRQPFRWLLHCEPDPFTKRRVNGPEDPFTGTERW